MKAKLKNIQTGEIIKVHATTDSPDSSYGIPCWVDTEDNSYGQVPYSPPPGFEIFDVVKDDIPPEDDPPGPYSRVYDHPLLNSYVPSARLPHIDALGKSGLLYELTAEQAAKVVIIAQTAYRNGQASMGAERIDTDAIWVNGIGVIERVGGEWKLTAPAEQTKSQAAAVLGHATSPAKTLANRAKANLPPKPGKKPRGRPRKQKKR